MIDQLYKNLPDSWNLVPICEIAQLNPRHDKAAHADNPLVTFVPMPKVEAGTGAIDVSETRSLSEVNTGYTSFLEGDVLFAKITPCMENGKMAIVPSLRSDLGFGSTEFHVLRPTHGISGQYLYFFVSSEDFRRQAKHNMTGAVGQRRVPVRYIADHPVPVPPVREQHRIVAKINELFSELDKGVESLKTVRSQLKIYRQAVLKQAFEGKLTAQWREENNDKLETAEQLLIRITQEREARYQHQLSEWKITSVNWREGTQQKFKPKKPLKPKHLSPLSTKDLNELDALPSKWRWVRIGEIGLVGTGVTPLKSKSDYYRNGDIPWLTSGALNDPFIRNPSGYVTETAYNETSLRFYPPHTLVVALYGEGKTRGKCSEILFKTTTNQAIAVIVQEGTAAGLRGLLKWFLTKNYDDVRTGSTGGVQPNLNLGIIENTAVPICSVSEAKEIEKEIEIRLSWADELDKQLVSCLQRSEHLRQSILNRAFRGELVAQDPGDEPATALLRRIKIEKASQEPKAKTRKRRVANA